MTDDEAWKIQQQIGQLEFPFTFLKALQFALFRTYGIPTISSLLTRTSEFSCQQSATKRYADTAVLIAEFMGNPPSSPRSRDGIARMNYIHSMYRKSGKILDDDMMYTLSLFALEPIRWIDRYEWRSLTDLEKCALGTFWKSVGDAMEINYGKLPSSTTGFKDGLQWLEEIEAWSQAYEIKYMVPHVDNNRVAEETVEILLWTVPRILRPLGRRMVYFLMDDRLRASMMYGIPRNIAINILSRFANNLNSRYHRPGWLYCFIFSKIFTVRKFFLRYLSLPRPEYFKVRRITTDPAEPPPHFLLSWEGAPYYVRPTLWNRWGPSAWLARLLKLPLPGDGGDTYYPNGYDTPTVGPRAFAGKGREYHEQTTERLLKDRRGQCPFVVSR
ncbi:hypothetical protein LOZ12_006781 [Ophidiomyces ophidiicola]|uniref:Uncharacterized protein n=1 Tax=Ophidiomyces ophidiicola TaxID=1387563 RepID=A0ACB8UM50_9EURO|nr:uncharacterized protein LOZ57_006488 [Ophidiomyces ophidiicola]KAI1905751.1 hypothetical protein LOZ64_006664 [Ophidiomyces ophidiicola]KAI1932272.1 hypothetical protein LOZ62_006702 [Ophidiomyces ophidiicola]KAI1937858.1 hypothetical protein LOZ57_006488 [Ophidiomyces ophidiicola]KAI1962730.1 hypothetical protein LOZ56_006548 [Ophidiomyces ophidiicola]KAI1998891.1 hypothetical protein LOZ50_006762 [Ophidiomyces ophidiicola]